MILGALKAFFLWLVTSAVGKAIIKAVVPVIMLATMSIGLGAIGLLPRSPLRIPVNLLANMVSTIPYFRYVAFFVPVVPILSALGAWLQAMIGFHVLMIYLRKSGIIK
ncbi:MAG: hypothetical protein FWB96_00835 [Defluviitaleaceae bacterium]|nr:hypothetical protein [Defluviitaleaceae bacterium]MCL2262753.1 hypothetical protein [Defluviitaleaceae bacterium]